MPTDNNHTHTHDLEDEGNYEYTVTEKDIRDKILHVLKIYPRLSPSHLQMGIGPSIPTSLWKPILERLIKDKVVFRYSVQAETPKGRIQVYTVLTLESELTPSISPLQHTAA